MNEKNYEFIISPDSCNGEEEQFLNWMLESYPNIDSKIENASVTGLIFENESLDEEEEFGKKCFWEQYCSA